MLPPSIINNLMWLGAVIIVINVLKLPTIKGWFGELQVRLAAKFLLDKNTYHAIHNVTLNTQDGTTQIDHIFVSPNGLFVVETKNYSGWIFGDQNHSTWTQKIYRSTHKFQNPIRQNYKHVKALETLLHIPIEKIHSVIVFVGNSTFKTPMPDNVTYAGSYIRYIKSKRDIVFSQSEVTSIVAAIESGRLASTRQVTQQHTKQLKSRSDLTSTQRCPRCGSAMVLRSTKDKTRQFWGCSTFPTCKGIINPSGG